MKRQQQRTTASQPREIIEDAMSVASHWFHHLTKRIELQFAGNTGRNISGLVPYLDRRTSVTGPLACGTIAGQSKPASAATVAAIWD